MANRVLAFGSIANNVNKFTIYMTEQQQMVEVI